MRLSTRLLGNAITTYARLATTFLLGLFTTWYLLGTVGVVGFGILALSISTSSPSIALERALRFGLVRELAVASSSADPERMGRSLNAAARLCMQTAFAVVGLAALLASAAYLGVFRLPRVGADLDLALAILIVAEGVHSAVRLRGAPYTQSIFAAGRVEIDNLLQVLARTCHTLSILLVFGWVFPTEPLDVQLMGFAATRVSLQLTDVLLGIGLAQRLVPGIARRAPGWDEAEYRSMRATVWHSSQATLLLTFNPQIVAVLVNLFFGLTYNAIWQIVVQFAGFARVISEGLLRGIEPLATRLQETRGTDATVELMTRSIRYQLAVALPTFALLAVHAEPLLQLWVGPRLAADPYVTLAGITAAEALALTATMAVILLAAHTLRAVFFGVERILYGAGHVRSYAWFAKWSTLMCSGLALAGMAWARSPIAGAVAILVSSAMYSPVAVLSAARRAVRFPLTAGLRRALPRPLAANLLLFIVVGGTSAVAAPPPWTPLDLVILLSGAALVYAPLVYWVIGDDDERAGLNRLLTRGGLSHRSAAKGGDEPHPFPPSEPPVDNPRTTDRECRR